MTKSGKCMASIAIGIVLYTVLHAFGTAARGYEAVGGEIVAFLVPFFFIAFQVVDWRSL